MVKPVSVWEAIMWVSVVVMLVAAVITVVVHDDWTAAWVSCLAAMTGIFASGGERRRVLQQHDRD